MVDGLMDPITTTVAEGAGLIHRHVHLGASLIHTDVHHVEAKVRAGLEALRTGETT
jgi:hypothetical protein